MKKMKMGSSLRNLSFLRKASWMILKTIFTPKPATKAELTTQIKNPILLKQWSDRSKMTIYGV